MNSLAPYIAALHQLDLLEEADLERRARLSRASKPGIAGWRRNLGTGARSLSGLFASAARSLDPTVETEATARRMAEPAVGRLLSC